MRRNIGILWCFVLLLLCSGFRSLLYSQDAQPARIKVKTQNANVRWEPNLTSRIIAQLPSGTILESSSKQGQWFKVTIPVQFKAERDFGFVFETIVDVLPVDNKPVAESLRTETRPDKTAATQEPVVQKSNYDEIAWIINKNKHLSSPIHGVPGGKEEVSWVINRKGSASFQPSSPAQGGEKSSKPLSLDIGVIPGLAVASLSAEAATKSKTAFDIGAFAEILLSPSLCLRGGINYVNRGGIFSEGPLDARWTIHYLQIPILAKYRFLSSGRLTAEALAGPYASFALSRSESVTNSATGDVISEENLSSVSFFHCGLIFGGEITYSLSKSLALLMELNYEWGLNSIGDFGVFTSTPAVKSRALILNLGIVIHSKGGK